MIVLALRTDKPEAELYLFKDGQKTAEIKWEAHLKLAETLNSQIEKILNPANFRGLSQSDYRLLHPENKRGKQVARYDLLDGIAVYKGPGSFTGLRIGMSVANALSYATGIPIVVRNGRDWLEQSVKDLARGQNDRTAVPEYGAPARTTKPRK